MKVHSSQVVIGCIITHDVMGSTKRPLIPKNTVVQSIHMKVLNQFKVGVVEVASKLSDGSPFIPEEKIDEPEQEKQDEKAPISFQDQYLDAVRSYKKWFEDWRGGAPVDTAAVRKVMVPLLERAVKLKRDVFLLHHYSSKKEYFYHHSVAVSLIAGYLASRLQYGYGDWMQVGLAGVFADSGMAKIDSKIMSKTDTLNEHEFEQIKTHPTHSYRLVEKIPSLTANAKVAVLQHHERLDGSGYPLGLKHEKLHIFSQIIAVSDMYHAMTSERAYRKKHSPFRVIEEMQKEQFGRFNPTVVSAFVKEMTNFSQGTRVRLSNNKLADIVFVESAYPTRPLVKLEEDQEIYSLRDHPDLHIEEVLD
ncbi:HD-GYP domain-containing protein [Halobacillus litoralis]|uniref:HD-GYP domain-containing protein n=1 Tax=Halobacillus litoralis TaxID=45668 RepID=UPI001CD47237|nr:HD-GYP domain-containing protein [Halobacillus litoralis]MCA0972355.1 HD-GYP domain-containing protein [Halobacillus litoralis]